MGYFEEYAEECVQEYKIKSAERLVISVSNFMRKGRKLMTIKDIRNEFLSDISIISNIKCLSSQIGKVFHNKYIASNFAPSDNKNIVRWCFYYIYKEQKI